MKRYQLMMALLASLLFLTEGMQAKITLPAFSRMEWCCNNKALLLFGEIVIRKTKGHDKDVMEPKEMCDNH